MGIKNLFVSHVDLVKLRNEARALGVPARTYRAATEDELREIIHQAKLGRIAKGD